MVAGRNGHGVPIIGSEKTFNVQQHDAPMAHPVAQLIPHQGGATLNIFGGLSKFEYFVGQALANPTLTEANGAESLIDWVQDVCDVLEKRQEQSGDKN